jgi:hypothetical protein
MFYFNVNTFFESMENPPKSAPLHDKWTRIFYVPFPGKKGSARIFLIYPVLVYCKCCLEASWLRTRLEAGIEIRKQQKRQDRLLALPSGVGWITSIF